MHFRAQRVPFLGRSKELQLLDDFLRAGSRFAWWIEAGEAGSGKSRLGLELCLQNQEDWRVGFLPQESNFQNWLDWQPVKPTLIVAEPISSTLLASWSMNHESKFRVELPRLNLMSPEFGSSRVIPENVPMS